MSDVKSPLTEEHLTLINEGLAKVAEGKQHIEMAARAGMHFPEEAKQLDTHETKLRSIKQVYFPGR